MTAFRDPEPIADSPQTAPLEPRVQVSDGVGGGRPALSEQLAANGNLSARSSEEAAPRNSERGFVRIALISEMNICRRLHIFIVMDLELPTCALFFRSCCCRSPWRHV